MRLVCLRQCRRNRPRLSRKPQNRIIFHLSTVGIDRRDIPSEALRHLLALGLVFDSYAGQKLQVTGEQPAAGGVMVHSQIVRANGEGVNVDYMMRRNGNAWLTSDIYLDGAISEVATRRSEFAAILKSQGIDGLIAALNRKADILTGTTARSF